MKATAITRGFFPVATAVAMTGGVLLGADSSAPRFRAVEIDSKIEIGYGVTVADIDGDGKPDIILADKTQIRWYKNPSWEKYVIAENLTTLDNVCIAAADIDGDGKAELAAGAGWNPSDTVNSGAVFYLVPPKDRTQKWEPVELPHEPTVHRMRWMRAEGGRFEVVVAPLHGRGNKNGQGQGARILAYQVPKDPKKPWTQEVISDSLHMTHNFELVKWEGGTSDELLVASKEGIFHYTSKGGQWKGVQLTEGLHADEGTSGAGEVRLGKLPSGGRFLVAVEPMHGDELVVYTVPGQQSGSGMWKRTVLDRSLKEGHALACGDLTRSGHSQIVVGWRGKNGEGKVGIKIFSPADSSGDKWTSSVLDDNTMACEDLCLSDLNGDGRLDVIAAGRATHNLKIYLNEPR